MSFDQRDIANMAIINGQFLFETLMNEIRQEVRLSSSTQRAAFRFEPMGLYGALEVQWK